MRRPWWQLAPRVKHNQCIVLNSGGLDSLVVLAYVISLGYKPLSLFINHGHISNSKESTASKQIAKYYNCPHFVESINLNIWHDHDFMLNGSKAHNPFIPMRNFILFSIAASYCDTMGIPNLGIGWDGIEKNGKLYSNGWDTHSTFINMLRYAFNEGSRLNHVSGEQLNIISPLVNYTKSDTAKLGLSLDVPFELSWSCFSGKRRTPCGTCVKCISREALKPLGITNKFTTLKG